MEERRDGSLHAKDAWKGRELWTSSDERFRPVDLKEGPDGALYVVDLYRGILQHRLFMTTFLRRQVLERGLDQGIGLGRIWRLVPEGHTARPAPALRSASWTELTQALSHPSGWWRDTAQRLIVEEGRGVKDARELCREHARSAAESLGRVHALWALASIDGLVRSDLEAALADGDARVRVTAMRLAEPSLATGEETLTRRIEGLAREGSRAERRQALLSLGEAETRAGDAALVRLLLEDSRESSERSLLLSGLSGRELVFLEQLFAEPAFDSPAPGRAELVAELARCTVVEGRSRACEILVALAAQRHRQGVPYVDEILAGMLAGRGKDGQGLPTIIRTTRPPAGLEPLTEAAQGETGALARELSSALRWPGRPGYAAETSARPLTPAEHARFELGRELYARTCAACHLSSGLGEAGRAPALRGSDLVLGSPGRLTALLMFGLRSAPSRHRPWEQEMPAFVAGDEELAAVMTYLRREWGHAVEPVDPGRVALRRTLKFRPKGPYTREELELVYGE
jgi:mono/diheme cytochrome c family protein